MKNEKDVAELHEWQVVIGEDGHPVADRLAVPSGWLYMVVRIDEDTGEVLEAKDPVFVPDMFAPHTARGVH